MTTPLRDYLLTLAVIHGLVTVKETDSRYRIMFVDSENNTFFLSTQQWPPLPAERLHSTMSNDPRKRLPAPASVNQGVTISTGYGPL